MKLRLLNTAQGLLPLYDTDYDEKKKLKKGEVYEATITLVRNVRFHRLYFSLINLSWEYLTEAQQEFFKNDVEVFRKAVQVAAGHCELCWSIAKHEWVEVPKSISFEKMDEAAFSDLYEKVKNVIYQVFIPDVNKDEFEYHLRNY